MPVEKIVFTKERLALVVNMFSRRARKDKDFVAQVESMFATRGPLFKTSSAQELPSIVRQVREQQPTILFICGGDGTLRQTLTHLVREYKEEPLPHIAILRGGTMNTVATSLRIYRAPLDHLRLLLERLDASLPHLVSKRCLLRINTDEYGFIFAVGGFARFIEYYQNQGSVSPTVAAMLVAKVACSSMVNGSLMKSLFKHFSAHVWCDERPCICGTDVTTISAASIRHLGFRFKPYIGINTKEERFGVLILRGSPRSLISQVPAVWFGKEVSNPNILQRSANRVLIKLPRALPLMVDGDILLSKKEILLTNGPLLQLVIG